MARLVGNRANTALQGHPSANGKAVCAPLTPPLLRLSPSGWRASPGRRWFRNANRDRILGRSLPPGRRLLADYTSFQNQGCEIGTSSP